MINKTNHDPERPLMHMFEVVESHPEPGQVFKTPMRVRVDSTDDLGGKDAVNGIAVLLAWTECACRRAVQALREVRHLLPPEGVVIVDAVLGRATDPIFVAT